MLAAQLRARLLRVGLTGILEPLDGADYLAPGKLKRAIAGSEVGLQLGWVEHGTGIDNTLDVVAGHLGRAFSAEDEISFGHIPLLHPFHVRNRRDVDGVAGLAQFVQGPVFHRCIELGQG